MIFLPSSKAAVRVAEIYDHVEHNGTGPTIGLHGVVPKSANHMDIYIDRFEPPIGVMTRPQDWAPAARAYLWPNHPSLQNGAY